MVASLKFESAAGTATAALDQVKIIILEDGTGNKYTLDTTTNDLKVAYTTSAGAKIEHTVNGLATALGKLLTIDGSTAGKSVLAEEVANKDVVKAIFSAKENATDPQSILVKEVAKEPVVKEILGVKNAAGTKTVLAEEVANKDVVKAIFDAKDGNNKISEIKIGATFAKKNASNLTDAANQKAFAEAILPAKDGNKSILVDKLEGFLAENAKVYSNNTKTAKELLVPSDAEIAAKVVNDPNFTVNVTDERIKEVVQKEMSQPSFEIPTSDDVALNWTW